MVDGVGFLSDVCLEVLTLLALHQVLAAISLDLARGLLREEHLTFHLQSLFFECMVFTQVRVVDLLIETLIVLIG